MRGDKVTNKATVERVAGNRHPVGAEDIFVTLPSRPRPGTELDQTEITRAAAKVGNEHQLVVVELLLVLIGSRNGLKFKLNLRKPCQPKSGTQTFERGIIFTVSFRSGEMGRTADDYTFSQVAKLFLCRYP